MLAVDVGGSRVKSGVVEGDAITSTRIMPTPRGPYLLDSLVELSRTGVAATPVDAVGLALKGVIDPATGMLVAVNDGLASLVGVPLAETVREAVGLPVVVENDARMFALGEMTQGSGRGYADVLCMTLGSGVGTGVAVGGRILRGPHGTLGILGGHVTVEIEGHLCSCGNVGCLETVANAAAVRTRAVRALGGARMGIHAGSKLGPEALFEAARNGHAEAIRTVRDFSRTLATGIVSLVHVYASEIVVLGGGLLGGGDVFLSMVRDYVADHAWMMPGRDVTVVAARFPDTAALVGLGEFALRGHAFL